MIKSLEAFPGTTGIGSLPHHNIDAALAFAFKTSIPFLPQIPIRNPWEYMIAQALEGMPGLSLDEDGSALLDLGVWTGRSHAFNDHLLSAFSSPTSRHAFSSFEPSTAASSSWQPFLWELEERKANAAKIQLAGPLTAQWALRLKDGSPASRYSEIGDQVYRLVLARALAMCRRLQMDGIQPILYLDEPGLYGLTLTNPTHVVGLQQLKLMIQALKKEDIMVGLHCCSNAEWDILLNLELDFVSIDTDQSLVALLSKRKGVEDFLERGGRFSLGVVPTGKEIRPLSGDEMLDALLNVFSSQWGDCETVASQLIRQSIYTPACGLALHSPEDAEVILESLLDFDRACRKRFA